MMMMMLRHSMRELGSADRSFYLRRTDNSRIFIVLITIFSCRRPLLRHSMRELGLLLLYYSQAYS